MLKQLSPEQVAGRRAGGRADRRRCSPTAPGNGAPIGGLKVVAESGWFAARPSGTEDVYKIYAESLRGRGAPRADPRRGAGARRRRAAAAGQARDDRRHRRLLDRARGRRGQAAGAADAGPRQAGRAVRRQLPADRLRALEPRQRGLPADRRAHAVQEPLAGPPHLARRGGCRRCSATTSRRCRRRCAAGRTGSRARPTRSTRTSTCSATSGRTIVFVFGADHIYRMDPRADGRPAHRVAAPA